MTRTPGCEVPFADEHDHWSKTAVDAPRTPEEQLMVSMFWRVLADAHPRSRVPKDARRDARKWLYCDWTLAVLKAHKWPYTVEVMAEMHDLELEDFRRRVASAGLSGRLGRMFGQSGRGGRLR